MKPKQATPPQKTTTPETRELFKPEKGGEISKIIFPVGIRPKDPNPPEWTKYVGKYDYLK